MEQDGHEPGEDCLKELPLYRTGTGTVISYWKDAHEAGEDCSKILGTIEKGTGTSAFSIFGSRS